MREQRIHKTPGSIENKHFVTRASFVLRDIAEMIALVASHAAVREYVRPAGTIKKIGLKGQDTAKETSSKRLSMS